MSVLLIVVLVAGFVLLAFGANFFVDGAAAVADKLSVPGFIIGLTVVAIGTSLPEVAVTITASIRGDNAMAISNVIGSNIFNLMVVLSAAAIVASVGFGTRAMRREFPFSIIVTVVLLVMGAVDMKIGHLDGVILLAICAFFLFWTVRSAKRISQKAEEEGEGEGEPEYASRVESIEAPQIKELSNPRCVIYIIAGGAAIAVGGWLAIGAAEIFAYRLGMSESLVGLTICAIGTSLPELVTGVVAARKDQTGIVVGNVLGSNVFNIVLVAGLATTISPVFLTQNDLIDLAFLLLANGLVLMMVANRRRLTRGFGLILLFFYALYMLYFCVRAPM